MHVAKGQVLSHSNKDCTECLVDEAKSGKASIGRNRDEERQHTDPHDTKTRAYFDQRVSVRAIVRLLLGSTVPR
jgi:hypothetical protein